MQRGAVVSHPAGHHRNIEFGDEGLKVQRFFIGGNPLRRDDGALDDQQVDSRRHQRRGERLGILRAHPHRGGDPGIPDAGHRRPEQFGVKRGRMQLLKEPDGGRRVRIVG